MANYDLSTVMNLADAQVMYKDLRDRYDPKYEKPATGIPATDLAAGVIPTVPVTDVQTNGTSILQNGIANIPVGSADRFGVFKSSSYYGITTSVSGQLIIDYATESSIKNATSRYYPIVPEKQHFSVFYGLSKVAGVDLKEATVTVGTYPDASKQAIQKLFGLDGIFGDYQNGITAFKAYAVGDTFIMNGKRYKVTAAISDGGLITVGTNCELDPLDGRYVKDTDIANATTPGVVIVRDETDGLAIDSNNRLTIVGAGSMQLHAGTTNYKTITPWNQHQAAFYGLSKAAGVDLKNETVTVGTYPATAKAAILEMLGANGNGLQILNGTLATDSASTTSIKNASNSYAPIVPSHIQDAAFFGLAKAAGADMASLSDVTVGVYPEAQKAAIQSMLGVSTGAVLIENVSGGTPTLTCLPNVRYKCGEVSTLSITPPASGSCEVIFESGSTATLLTVPNTVKFPPWFDATALETGMIYDIIITDGVYGAVMSWAS